MALTDTFVKQIKHTGIASGDKHTDGGGIFLLVKVGGNYRRMNYSFAEKRKALALGVYPSVTLAKARQRRDKARELLAYGTDPSAAKAMKSRPAQLQRQTPLNWWRGTFLKPKPTHGHPCISAASICLVLALRGRLKTFCKAVGGCLTEFPIHCDSITRAASG